MERMQGDLDFLEASASAAAAASPAHHFELRFCPFLRAAPVGDQIQRVMKGVWNGSSGKRGRTWGLTLIAMRGNFGHLQALEEHLGSCSGIDVAGNENGAETDPRWVYAVARLFEKAKACGVSTTYHTGEGALADTLAILTALPLDRIGHGVSLRRMERLPPRLPVLELCPSVNEITGVAPFQDVVDFAARLHREGHRFVFGSDNPVITGVDSAQQWQRLPEYLQRAARESSSHLHLNFPLNSFPFSP